MEKYLCKENMVLDGQVGGYNSKDNMSKLCSSCPKFIVEIIFSEMFSQYSSVLDDFLRSDPSTAI